MITRLVDSGRVLDFDIENRPLSYWYDGNCTAEITVIAASFGPDSMHVWALGEDDPRRMLEEFVALYNEATLVTGHYIRKHDLPIINGALLEYNMPPLSEKLTCDTKLDLVSTGSLSMSQESIAGMLGIAAPKVQMSQHTWRAANRLEDIESAKARCIGDVVQHQAMRARLLVLGMLRPARRWAVGVGK